MPLRILKYLFFLLLLAILLSFAQVAKDKDNKSDVSIDDLMLQTENIGTSNPKQFLKNLEKLKTLKSKLNNYQSEYLDYLSFYYQGYSGEFEKSSKNFEQLSNTSQFTSIKFKSQAKIVNISAIIGDIPKALKSLNYVLNNINNIQDQRSKILGYKVASLFYFLIDENKLALEFARLILNNNPNENEFCQAKTTITRIKIKQKSAVYSDIIDAIKVCEKSHDYVYSNFIRTDWLKLKLNSNLSGKKEYQFVLEQLLQFEKQIDQTNYKNLINIKDSLYAQVYWKLNQTEKSKYYALKTLRQNVAHGSSVQKIATLEVLINYYKQKGDFESAYNYSVKKNTTEKEHFNHKKAQIMAYQTAKHQLMAKNQEINYLNQKNELLSHEKILTNKAAWYQKLLIASLSIIVILILLWALRSNKIQKVYKNLSERDHMTLIYNRKGLKDYMDYLLPFSEKNNESVAYAIFDLDNFKKINDEYGHISGDWVIKKVIKECQTIQNNKITFGRIGGEEFAIVMHNSTQKELSEFAEQCRKNIEYIDTKPCGFTFKITASFGITSSKQSDYSYSQLMTHADQAMYDAKIAGRNMVVQYQNS